MKIFKFCSSKDSINGVKRQPTEWKKIFANHVSGKRLKAKIYRDLLKSMALQYCVGPVSLEATDTVPLKSSS